MLKALEAGSFEYLSKWYHAAIREMVLLDGFREDPSWIVRKLKGLVTDKEIKESIALLLSLGLVARDKFMRLKQVDRNLATDAEVADLVRFELS